VKSLLNFEEACAKSRGLNKKPGLKSTGEFFSVKRPAAGVGTWGILLRLATTPAVETGDYVDPGSEAASRTRVNVWLILILENPVSTSPNQLESGSHPQQQR
jgi:hypothetical protein